MNVYSARKDVLIMKKITLTFAILIVTVCLAGCGKDTATPQSSQSPATNTVPSESSYTPSSSLENPTETAQMTPSTDSIKWEDIKDPLINEAIKTKLKAAVDAIVSKDVDQFHQAIGEDLGTAHDYLLDNSMQFTSIEVAHKEKDRVLVPVSGEMRVPEAAEATEGIYTFYFEKGTQGEWNIVTID